MEISQEEVFIPRPIAHGRAVCTEMIPGVSSAIELDKVRYFELTWYFNFREEAQVVQVPGAFLATTLQDFDFQIELFNLLFPL